MFPFEIVLIHHFKQQNMPYIVHKLVLKANVLSLTESKSRNQVKTNRNTFVAASDALNIN
jgi:hypothetical protein